MRVAVYLPLLVSACFGLSARSLAGRLPPATVTWLLSVGGLVAAGSGLCAVGLLGGTLVGQLPEIAEGRWSVPALQHSDPVSRPAAAVALAVLIGCTTATAVVAWRRGRVLLGSYTTCRRLPVAPGNLVVVPDAAGGAFAVPGRPGRVVVARPLLAALTGPQRRVLLTHEQAHLRHRHHWHRIAAALAAAANPLLAGLPAATAYATERWADEDAAAVVDRGTAAEALRRATGLVEPTSRPVAARPLVATAAAARVRALRDRPPHPRPLVTTAAVTLVLLATLATAEAAHDTARLFESATDAYSAGQGR